MTEYVKWLLTQRGSELSKAKDETEKRLKAIIEELDQIAKEYGQESGEKK